jgi:hypothetical protein
MRLYVFLFCRNRPQYLRIALRSIQRQRLLPDMVVVSDNSTGEQFAAENAALCREFSALIPLTYVRQSGKLTIAEHFYFVCECFREQADVIAVHNDDDVWLSRHLEFAMREISRGASLFVGNAVVIDQNGLVVKRRLWSEKWHPPQGGGRALRFWLKRTFCPYPGYVFRSAALASVPQIDTPNIDAWISLWIAVNRGQIVCEKKPTFLYRKHGEQFSVNPKQILYSRHLLKCEMARVLFWRAWRVDFTFPLRVAKSVLYILSHRT